MAFTFQLREMLSLSLDKHDGLLEGTVELSVCWALVLLSYPQNSL